MKKPIKVLSFLILFSIIFLSFQTPIRKKITEQQAIVLAENFIRENGYTKAKANKSKIRFELFDYESLTIILKRRCNALHPKAFFISKDGNQWGVGFLSSSVNIKKLDSIEMKKDLSGRAVKMDEYGEEIRIAHKDPSFSRWEIIK